MCGRYAASTNPDRLIEIFEVDTAELPDPGAGPAGLADWTQPRWNIAPTDTVPAVLDRDRTGERMRRLSGLRWGLVPSWSKAAAGAARLINARFETIAAKPAFKKSFAARRCLLPADGYYEWYPATRNGKAYKQPFYIRPQSELLVMAGIYEFWRDPNPPPGHDGWLVSCAIITTNATDDLGQIHDRMPVQVLPENWDAWLDPQLTDPAQAADLVHIPTPGQLHAYAVDTRVNKVGNDGPELIEPLPQA